MSQFLCEASKVDSDLYIKFRQRFEFDDEKDYQFGVPKNLGYKTALDIHRVVSLENRLTKVFYFVPEDVCEVADKEFYKAKIIFEPNAFPPVHAKIGVVNSVREGYDLSLQSSELLERLNPGLNNFNKTDLKRAMELADKLEELKKKVL